MTGEYFNLGNPHRITFGIIVLNGEPFTRYNLRALYPFAHQIIVVEGASPKAADSATDDGHSVDETLLTIRNFLRDEDPEHKVVLITAEDENHPNGFWPGDKDEQSQAYAKRATGDWLWQIDVDEFYQPNDMQRVINYLVKHPKTTCITFNFRHFWGGFDYVVTGGLFMSDGFAGEVSGAVRRVFRWGPGYRYLTHRPPTVQDEAGNLSDRKKINFSKLHRGVKTYHYFMVFPNQVIRKGQYYDRQGWKHEINVEERYRRLFSRLTQEDAFHIFTHRGTHNWLERFEGEHPPAILELMQALKTSEEKLILRDASDIEEILASWDYETMRWFYFASESTRAAFTSWINFLKRQIKIALRWA